jgi:nitrogen regulatory protein P-II 1
MATLITAVIRPHALDQVKAALSSAGVSGITVTEVKGAGRQGGKTETYRGAEYTIDYLPKIKVEVIVPDATATEVEEVIAGAARTEKIGDGKIWSIPLGSLMRIRTGERGDDAT